MAAHSANPAPFHADSVAAARASIASVILNRNAASNGSVRNVADLLEYGDTHRAPRTAILLDTMA